jgi:hypothetical protein
VSAGFSRVKNQKLIRQISFISYVPKNPADAFYGIKFEEKTSVLSASILYLLFFLIYVLNKYATGFLFKTVQDGLFELVTDSVIVFGVIGAFVICGNLICSITDGEGKLKHMYQALAYCLMPYIVIKPILIILSHTLTYNERFLLSFGNVFIEASVVLLIFIMVKEIQAYKIMQTVRCLLLTIFTCAILAVTLVIVFALINQVVEFISALIREAYFRAI